MARTSMAMRVVFFAFFLGPATLSAQFIATNSSTGIGYTTIQAAIDARTNNYNVYVYGFSTNKFVISGKTNLVVRAFFPGIEVRDTNLGATTYGIDISSCRGVTIQNFTIANFYNGINLGSGCENVEVIGCLLRSNTSSGFSLNATAPSSGFSNLLWNTTITGPTGLGIYGDNGTTRLYLVSNNLSNVNTAINLGAVGACSNNFIVGNRVEVANYGVYVNQPAMSNQVLGNTFYGSGTAIRILGGYRNQIASNLVFGTSSPISLTGCSNALIESNLLVGYANNGIALDGPSHQALLRGNRVLGLSGTSVNGILLQNGPTNAVLTGNLVLSNGTGLSIMRVTNLSVASNAICDNTGYGFADLWSSPASIQVSVWLNILTNNGSLNANSVSVPSLCLSNYYGSRASAQFKVNANWNPFPWLNTAPGGNGDWQPAAALTSCSAVASGPGVVQLSWGPVSGAADFDRYLVWRANENSFTNLGTQNLVGTILSSGTTTFTDNPVTAGTNYYWVTVLDANGNESGYSPTAQAAYSLTSAQGVASNSATGLFYSNVQAAINAATNNYTVYVYNSSWELYDTDIFNKTNLTVTKAPWAAGPVEIRRTNGGPGQWGFLVMTSQNAVVSGLTIADFPTGVALYSSDTGCGVQSCILRSNAQGLAVLYGANQSNFFLGNTVWGGSGNGITLQDGTFNVVASNQVSLHSNGIAAYGTGGALLGGGRIFDNQVDQSLSNGILLASAASNVVTGNRVGSSGAEGILARHCQGASLCSNTVSAGSAAGVAVFMSSNTLVSSNRVQGGSAAFLVTGFTNHLEGNLARGASQGILVRQALGCVLDRNHGESNLIGVLLGPQAYTNRLASNAFCDNSKYGYYGSNGCFGTVLTLNAFANNALSNLVSFDSIDEARSNYFGAVPWASKGVSTSAPLDPWLLSTPGGNGDFDLPASPTNLAVSSSGGRALLAWVPVATPDVSGYRIYRALDADYSNLGGASLAGAVSGAASSAFVDNPMQPGPLFYRITAVDSNGNESWFSPAASVTISGFSLVSGSVTGAITNGVRLTVTGDAGLSTNSDTNGAYAFFLADGAYRLTPTRLGYRFAPGSLDFTLAGSGRSNDVFTAAEIEPILGLSNLATNQAVRRDLVLRLESDAPEMLASADFTVSNGAGTAYYRRHYPGVPYAQSVTLDTTALPDGAYWASVDAVDIVFGRAHRLDVPIVFSNQLFKVLDKGLKELKAIVYDSVRNLEQGQPMEIYFHLNAAQNVQVNLYDHLGHLLRAFASREFPAGYNRVAWEKNELPPGMPAGVYYVRIKTPNTSEIDKTLPLVFERR